MYETYFDWLKDQVEYFDGPKHDDLLAALHSIEYTPIMSKDENRAIDGVNLRDEYFKECGDRSQVIDGPCSFLEFLIALAQRMNYIYARMDEDRTADCFWTMLQNAGILIDERYDEEYVRVVVDDVINRTYQPDGTGGLFPLNNPRTNQRNVEVWYQMNQYLTEIMRKEGRL